VAAAVVLAFLLLVYSGRRRSATLDVMSGIGDERAKLLYTRAVAFSSTVRPADLVAGDGRPGRS
jgi:hypothetical protein